MSSGSPFSQRHFMSNPAKIVNGVPAEEGEYPYAASLGQFGSHFCGGSLITPSVVLTAAHCFESGANQITGEISTFGITVTLGCNDIENDPNCEVIPVASGEIHPNYDFALSVSGGNDLCLLQLSQPSSQPFFAQIPSPLVGQEAFTDFFSFEIGWGNEIPALNTFVGGEDLKEADTLVLNNDVCEQQNDILFDLVFGETNTIDDTMICSIGDFKSVCQGDSGGPLAIKCEGEDQDIVIGATSFGLGCAAPGHPNIFARTFNQAGFDFIQQFVTNVGEIADLSVVDNLGNFCQDVPPLVNNAPTPFPTINADAWTCDPTFYATQDGCDCNCGIPDPDCLFDQENVFGCAGGVACNADGTCAGGDDNVALIAGLSVGGTVLVCCVFAVIIATLVIMGKMQASSAANNDNVAVYAK